MAYLARGAVQSKTRHHHLKGAVGATRKATQRHVQVHYAMVHVPIPPPYEAPKKGRPTLCHKSGVAPALPPKSAARWPAY